MKLEMKEWSPEEQIRGLFNRQIDMTFLTGANTPAGCDAIPIFRAQLYVAVPRDSVFAGQSQLRFEDLAKAHFIVSSRGFGSDIRDLIAKQLSELGFSPDVETYDVGREALMNMVGMNFGVSLTSDVSIGVTYPGVAFVPIAGELLPVNAVYSPENDNPALRRFLSLARTLAKEQSRDAPSQRPDL